MQTFNQIGVVMPTISLIKLYKNMTIKCIHGYLMDKTPCKCLETDSTSLKAQGNPECHT